MTAARLLIHAPRELGRAASRMSVMLQRLQSHRRGMTGDKAGDKTGAKTADARSLLSLQIHDLQGHHVLALDEICPLVEVFLTPGTYHVTTDGDGAQQRYTVALVRGASFDLYVQRAQR